MVISFQIKLYLLIIWVRSSGLIQDYRIFEDMHHGITIRGAEENQPQINPQINPQKSISNNITVKTGIKPKKE